MARSTVFRTNRSQAVRLPKQFRFQGDEVEIFRRGDEVVLREKSAGMARAFELLASLPRDAVEDLRPEKPPQEREGI